MLSPRERQAIEQELSRYPDRKAVGVEALKAVQSQRGWVSDEALRDVAEFLNLAPEDLEAVATFYNLIFRQPVGRHVILLCDSVSCWLMGYEAVRERLRAKLGIDFGQTSADGRFTLLPSCCLGSCDHAPVLMIDEELHRHLDPQQLEPILERYP